MTSPCILPSGGKRASPSFQESLIRGEPLNGGDKMPSKKKRIAVYLGLDEYGNIQGNANKAELSLSTFCKKVCTDIPVPNMEHQ